MIVKNIVIAKLNTNFKNAYYWGYSFLLFLTRTRLNILTWLPYSTICVLFKPIDLYSINHSKII